MDIFNFLRSANKVAIAAFFLTGSILLYEIYLFIKQAGGDKKRPKIPELQKINLTGLQKTLTVVKKNDQKNDIVKLLNRLVIIVLVVLVIILGGVFATGIWKNTPLSNHTTTTPTPYYQLVASDEIKIYNDLWQELTKNQLRYFKSDDKILIGIKNIAGTDITKARIRINAKTWTSQDEVEAFNQKFDVFYKSYQIASTDGQLKIEAQLYSKKDGWLGE